MSEKQEIIEQNNIATDYVVGTPGSFDSTTAELVLRNSAVVVDRLTPQQFAKLGQPAIEAVLNASAIAKEIAPLSAEDQRQLPVETAAEHQFRTEVFQPLHGLQSLVSLEKFDSSDPATVSMIKKAVWLGSTAFEKVVTDPSASEFPALQSTLGYFGGNSRAAAGRAERSKNTSSNR